IMAVGSLDKRSEIKTNNMFMYLRGKLGSTFEGFVNIELEQMDEIYYETDVFILTSKHRSESFGRTIVEAMSRKCVVLTTDAGGPSEVVKNRYDIYNTHMEFVNRIMEMYNNPGIMEKDKQLNFERFKGKYSLQNNIEKHLQIYKYSN